MVNHPNRSKKAVTAHLYIPRLEAAAADLFIALKTLIEASGHISPLGGESSVQAVRRAGKYLAALDRAQAVIAKIEG